MPIRGFRYGREALLASILLTVGLAILTVDGFEFSVAAAGRTHERRPQTVWRACNRNARNGKPSTFQPLSDSRAAGLVTSRPEDRPDNALPYTVGGTLHVAVNDYVPSLGQIATFRRARTDTGRLIVRFNPYYRYVDGRDGLSHPSTDELIQWSAHKWGIPEDWLRAEYVHESYWSQWQLGDQATVSANWYQRYPQQARAGRSTVYQSLGITQVKWLPDGSIGGGAEPLRWQSTAFNVDYQAATVRFYYDNPSGARSEWGDTSYTPCQAWNSIGGWYRPYQWGNADQEGYVQAVRDILASRGWTSPSFVNWSPPALPPGVVIKK